MAIPWERMSVNQLEKEIERLLQETYETEWENEFVRQEIKELRALLDRKINSVEEGV